MLDILTLIVMIIIIILVWKIFNILLDNLIVDSYLQIIRLRKLRNVDKVVNKLMIQFKSVVTLRNLNSCHMMIHWKHWTMIMQNEIFSPPFQPNSPTDSDLERYSVHTSESNSKNDSANNSLDDPHNKSDNDIYYQ